jgi:hypothetical protein
MSRDKKQKQNLVSEQCLSFSGRPHVRVGEGATAVTVFLRVTELLVVAPPPADLRGRPGPLLSGDITKYVVEVSTRNDCSGRE